MVLHVTKIFLKSSQSPKSLRSVHSIVENEITLFSTTTNKIACIKLCLANNSIETTCSHIHSFCNWSHVKNTFWLDSGVSCCVQLNKDSHWEQTCTKAAKGWRGE